MKFLITSDYGVLESVRNGRIHEGIDLAMPMDTPLRSFCNGIVERVVNYGDQNIGKGIIIRAGNGARYIYGHMDEVDVRMGETVHPGSFLGLSGSTGHSTGPHLHFGETIHGHFVDPSPVIAKVDKMAGGKAPSGWYEHLKDQFDIQQHIQDAMSHALMGALVAAGGVALHMAYAVVLIGAGILIILKQLGFQHRWLKPSVLVGGYIIIRFLFGG